MQARYALASTADSSSGLVWSTGSYWSAGTPEVSSLMTGPQVDAFAARHPDAVIVDVLVYNAAWAVYHKASKEALGGVEYSTPELRAKAREAGRAALVAAGYGLMAAKSNPFNPCEA